MGKEKKKVQGHPSTVPAKQVGTAKRKSGLIAKDKTESEQKDSCSNPKVTKMLEILGQHILKLENHEVVVPPFPLDRVKKVMRLEETTQDVEISDEAAAVLAKAAEFFTRETSIRSYDLAKQYNRNVIQINDLSYIVDSENHFEFLIDLVPASSKVPSRFGLPKLKPMEPSPLFKIGRVSRFDKVYNAEIP